jgi:ABC-type oligopeptide transport system ATPase subunit
MRQRVMIAMALACRPRLLIADEPTTALDVTVQAQVLRLIAALQRELGMGLIFITHDMGVVAEIADRVVVMREGEKVEEGPVGRIFEAPAHPYTQMLLAAVPALGSLANEPLPMPFPEPGGPTPQPQATVHGDPVLAVHDLVTRFEVRRGLFGHLAGRVHAVEHVSFELRPGETLALVGESGCGKSTTGRSIIRLEQPDGGSIRLDGRDVSKLDKASEPLLRRAVQYVFQDPFASLDPRLTVGFSIAEPIRTHGLAPASAVPGRVQELLERVGLPAAFARRYPHELSGGQRQRVAIARALASNPQVIIADEAVAALDVSIRAQVVNLLMALQARLGVAYLFISHDMAVVERVADDGGELGNAALAMGVRVLEAVGDAGADSGRQHDEGDDDEGEERHLPAVAADQPLRQGRAHERADRAHRRDGAEDGAARGRRNAPLARREAEIGRGAGERHAHHQTGAERQRDPAGGEDGGDETEDVEHRAGDADGADAEAVGIGADEGLRRAPDEVLDRDREGEIRDGDAEIARHRHHEETEARAHAHADAKHDRGADDHLERLGPRRPHALHFRDCRQESLLSPRRS